MPTPLTKEQAASLTLAIQNYHDEETTADEIAYFLEMAERHLDVLTSRFVDASLFYASKDSVRLGRSDLSINMTVGETQQDPSLRTVSMELVDHKDEVTYQTEEGAPFTYALNLTLNGNMPSTPRNIYALTHITERARRSIIEVAVNNGHIAKTLFMDFKIEEVI